MNPMKKKTVYIIAELSANHNGDFDRAIQIVRAAASAGADAIKLQTYTADTITLDVDSEIFRVGPGTPWEGKKLHDLYNAAFTPWEWQPKIKAEAQRLGMDCISTPFDTTAVDFLEKMDVPAYKIASFELVDIPLIKYTAAKGKPMIMSVGMATEEEIRDALDAVRATGNNDITLLKCVSAYPADPEDMNLATIPDIKKRFAVEIGLSDHTLSHEVAIAAVALGAVVVEKHITLSRSDGGFDASFSLEPDEFKKMVDSIRIVEKALGSPTYGTEKENPCRLFRKSLFVAENIREGEKFTPENIRSVRPGNGLPPKHYEEILGKTAMRDMEKGAPLSWDAVK